MIEALTSPPWLPPTLLTLVAAATPGPNNLLMVQAVAQRGALGFVRVGLGVLTGGVTMLLLASSVADWAGQAMDGAQRAIAMVGAAYLMVLAVQLWRASDPGRASTTQPLAAVGVVEAAVLQWINPKGWALVATLVASGQGVSERSLGTAGSIVIFVVVSASCLMAWGLVGGWMHSLGPAHPMRRQAGHVMALALAACACDMVLRA